MTHQLAEHAACILRGRKLAAGVDSTQHGWHWWVCQDASSQPCTRERTKSLQLSMTRLSVCMRITLEAEATARCRTR